MSAKKRSFTIRQTKDVELVKSLHSEILPSDDFYWSHYPVYHWVVRDEKRNPVGFCSIAMWDSKIGFLCRSGVLPEARGNGLQVRMTRVREKFARAAGYESMVTYTDVDNIRSSHNLQKIGYMLFEPEQKWAGKSYLYWMKKI